MYLLLCLLVDTLLLRTVSKHGHDVLHGWELIMPFPFGSLPYLIAVMFDLRFMSESNLNLTTYNSLNSSQCIKNLLVHFVLRILTSLFILLPSETCSVRAGLSVWLCEFGGLGTGCMAISCILLDTRRVPSDEPRETRSTWSNMEEEDNCSSAPLPDVAPWIRGKIYINLFKNR